MDTIAYDEAAVRDSFDDGSWMRGQRYYRQGHIHSLTQEGNELRALCVGSRPQPYTVSVRLGPRGFEDAHCTCPIGEYGDCKHVVALMLTYLHSPALVPEVQPPPAAPALARASTPLLYGRVRGRGYEPRGIGGAGGAVSE